MIQKIMNFIKDEDGLELTEYAVIGALIVVGIVGAIIALGDRIDEAFDELVLAIDGTES